LNWSSAINISSLQDGELTLCVIDSQGLITDDTQLLKPATVSWIKDTSQPVVTLSSQLVLVTQTNQSNYTLSGSCSEENKDVILSGVIDSSALCTGGVWSSNINLSSILDGSFSVYITMIDAVGNASSELFASLSKDTRSLIAILTNTPPIISNETVLNVGISGTGIDSYFYKLGPDGSTNCTVASGYSNEVTSSTAITDSLLIFSDQNLKLCVIGKNSNGNVQSYSTATTWIWAKDTNSPSITLSNTDPYLSKLLFHQDKQSICQWKLGFYKYLDSKLKQLPNSHTLNGNP